MKKCLTELVLECDVRLITSVFGTIYDTHQILERLLFYNGFICVFTSCQLDANHDIAFIQFEFFTFLHSTA